MLARALIRGKKTMVPGTLSEPCPCYFASIVKLLYVVHLSPILHSVLKRNSPHSVAICAKYFSICLGQYFSGGIVSIKEESIHAVLERGVETRKEDVL